MNQKDLKNMIKDVMDENVQLQHLVVELLERVYCDDKIDFANAKHQFETLLSHMEDYGAISFDMISNEVAQCKKNREDWAKKIEGCKKAKEST